MTSRKLSAFIDALVSGRRPRKYPAGADDVDVLRMAISLRAARPGDAVPDERFVSDLYQQLADQAGSPSEAHAARPARVQRARAAVAAAAAAASIVLVAGTATVTEVLTGGAVTTAAVPVPHGQLMRTATFEAANGEALGQIVAYEGHPSWVFMNVRAANYDGRITCMLKSKGGSVVAVGAFEMHDGAGQFSRVIRVDVSQLRGARLVNNRGAVVASATFV